ncbi:GntR family transcriptional regulator [Herbiconiux ginsengi]|uniref:Transcriptional regulator, GntR family n=1 Tax=Herbiconiux ginsengi TaxID=381665 RepID=A0A1H3S093_9MICO|nr:GntR family transcriptional regulator [Herbiconiux ginsengi]SDZ31406.1 transcriptional regulator, GntR family [Herbiconiux ginsengi]
MSKGRSETEDLIDTLIAIWTRVNEAHGRMPSEPQLAAETGASRTSVREALIRLEERGYIHRSHGARTVINSNLGMLGTRVDQQRDHLVAIARAGYEPGLRLVSASYDVIAMPVPGAPEPFHDLPPGTPVLRTRKVWSADGRAYVLADDVIPIVGGRSGADARDELDATEPVFDLAERLNGVAVAWETVSLAAEALSDDERAAMHLDAPEPALVLSYCGLGAAGDVAYWCREVQLPAPTQLRNVLVRRVTRG